MLLELNTDLANSVSSGTLIVTECPHAIMDCRPDLIIDAIRTMSQKTAT